LTRSIANQIDDDIQTHQRLSFPIHRNVIEQTMLNFVPLTRARRKMTHMNRESRLIRKLLQTILPQTTATAVAPTAIRRNENLLRLRIQLLA
jgi:hypothetical protein